MKVLIVEDTLTSATVIGQMLGRMGLRSIHAPDGLSGVEAFQRERPDLVLLDVIMPGVDGFEVARRIRQLESDGEWTPIMFLSARTSDEDFERGIESGGDDYLVKPVSQAVLKAKVRAMQRIAQMRQSLLVLSRKLNDANRELTRLTAVDGLTGIANRRAFDQTLLREWRRAARAGTPISLALIDVDQFKQFNDGYGHQLGDGCLKAIATALEQTLHRPTDMIARYGGEEFVAILPEANEAGAAKVCEDLRRTVEALRIRHEFSPVAPCVTASIGVATARPARHDEMGFTDLLLRADNALYAAKREGRNRVAQATPVIAAVEQI